MDDVTQEPPADDPVLPQLSRETAEPVAPAEPSHGPAAVQTLRLAMRRARFDDAERVGVQADLRVLQIGRLEVLQDALTPLLAQIPKSADLFDVGLMPGATPRLFIDMIGFVEMGRDARLYRLLQDTRHQRVTLAETTDVPTMVEAITDYVARRLLERDKALAADAYEPAAVPAAGTTPATDPASPAAKPRKRRPVLRFAGAAFGFLIDLLGAITFFTLIAVGAWMIWARLHGQT